MTGMELKGFFCRVLCFHSQSQVVLHIRLKTRSYKWKRVKWEKLAVQKYPVIILKVLYTFYADKVGVERGVVKGEG